MLVPQLADTVGEVNLDSTFIDEDIVHPTVRQDAFVLSLELNERELQ